MGLRSDGRMERPIMFTGDLVRKVMAGEKTETRRPVRLPAGYEHGEVYAYGGRSGDRFLLECDPGPHRALKCPYGLPGDLLWVRETFGTIEGGERWVYRADDGWAENEPESKEMLDGHRWRPAIHMPREASRVLLVVDSVRIEPVQDITDEGARAEGFADRAAFLAAWQAMYPKGEKAWDNNPWVWVVSFKVEEEMMDDLTKRLQRREALALARLRRHSEFGICPGCGEVFTRAEVAEQMWPTMPKGRPRAWSHDPCLYEVLEGTGVPIMVRPEGDVVVVRWVNGTRRSQ